MVIPTSVYDSGYTGCAATSGGVDRKEPGAILAISKRGHKTESRRVSRYSERRVSPAGQTSRSSDLISVTEELRDITRFGRFRAGGHAGPPLRNVVLFDFHVDDGAVWSASILPRRA